MTAAQQAQNVTTLETENSRWMRWLMENVESDWMLGQWNTELWLFTCDPADVRNTVSCCRVEDCGQLIDRYHLCGRCSKAYHKSNLTYENFLATYRSGLRSKRIPATYGVYECCQAERDGARCPRTATTQGVCRMHYSLWLKSPEGKGTRSMQEWIAHGKYRIPDRNPPCIVPTCGRERRSVKAKVCILHWHRYHDTDQSVEIERWAAHAPVYVASHQFSLVHLDECARMELLYAVQQRVAKGQRLYPETMRGLVRLVERGTSLSAMSDADIDRVLGEIGDRNLQAHLVEFCRLLRCARNESLGKDPMDATVWDLVEVGLLVDPTPHGGTRRRKGLDFGVISQLWLREATVGWARDQTDRRAVYLAREGASIASATLRLRPDRGDDMRRLTANDASDVAEAIRRSAGTDGEPRSARYNRTLYVGLFRIIDHGRRSGVLESLPGVFTRTRSHVFADVASNDDGEVGKALPDVVVRQLDANLDSLGSDDFFFRSLSLEHRSLMYRTIYTLLRDTGRRPLEIASLRRACVSKDANGFVLIWDNHKARRFNRRLPILEDTADAVAAWASVRDDIAFHERCNGYLFPSNTGSTDHLSGSSVAMIVRRWVDSLDQLHCGVVDSSGELVDFDRSLVYPYAFRHTYAQRHADNGTPIDVLRDLMDHRTVVTTASYYRVTAERKRQAIVAVGKHSVDRLGRSSPMTDSTRYQIRSVAVPFGNCIEPANVKAGGQSCPIRFQCAGCGFYRPDPSYIPAIEEHLNSLRADRETARAIDAAEFVVDNLSAQISAFDGVLSHMRQSLDSLEPTERDRVERASATLRKIRAGASLPITVIKKEDSERS